MEFLLGFVLSCFIIVGLKFYFAMKDFNEVTKNNSPKERIQKQLEKADED